MVARLSQDRKEVLRRSPQLAETNMDHHYLTKRALASVAALRQRIGLAEGSEQTKHDNKQSYLNTRGRPRAGKADPVASIAAEVVEVGGLKGVAAARLASEKEYGLAVVKARKFVKEAEIKFVEGKYQTEVILDDGSRITGAVSWNAYLSLMDVLLILAERYFKRKWDHYNEKIAEGKRGVKEFEGPSEPGLKRAEFRARTAVRRTGDHGPRRAQLASEAAVAAVWGLQEFTDVPEEN